MFRRGRTDENSIDEEGQFDDGDVDIEERKNAHVTCLLRCLISIISKLAAVSFSLVLAEVVLLIVVADYRFVDYFLRWVGDDRGISFSETAHDMNLTNPFF
jgi:hypothetical protein